ncbi:alkaline shock response membrane anchor protein AmaP [Spongiactinospora sp. TRM90649]|uniref:alkaline shock response membrane anchor protein AmaP n=1 Tax=Spongiactinospora sp. TRM90649 TaxID=3031114 RepID=UPI0023F62448|nr:alkaline shock response membrane anchor protein AmaP [Spongiactinospora sp. TRM90649]MDF5753368.1 alkaline shock response membrane anchor protein AmaP [Spongiactinospora sp. TRM90649]
MERKTARGNRLGLILCGLVLLLPGLYALARGLGLFGSRARGEYIISAGTAGFFTADPWAWWVLAAISIVAALLGLRWLLAQARKDTLSGLRLAKGPTGTTDVEADGITRALESELADHPSVLRAKAILTGSKRTPGVRLALVADETSRLDELRGHLGAHAVPRMRDALEVEHLPAVVRLKLEEPSSRPRPVR